MPGSRGIISTATAYEPVIGLEVHVQLATRSKLFCPCSTRFGAPPNTNVCPICLGHPGVLPVLNREAVELALRLALAVGAAIRPRSRFARKNYFYPDLPKGYQISQYDEPYSSGGGIAIDGEDGPRRIGITRIHLEEDAGKSLHDAGRADGASLVDFNRSGVGLIECVSEPELRSPREAYEYLTELRAVVQYCGVSAAHMEEGSLRCDANISLRPRGRAEFGVKTEIKNMNSFRNVERAITWEIERQARLLESGGTPVQETRLWDAARGETVTMRSKEEAHDYRYFPEPDLPPLDIAAAWIEAVRARLPELPRARRERFTAALGLPPADARILSLDRELAGWFEAAVAAGGSPRETGNWILRDLLRWAKETGRGPAGFPFPPAALAELVGLTGAGTISSAQAKAVFEEMLASGRSPGGIVAERGLAQVSDTGEIDAAVERVIARNPAEAERYRSGKTGLLGFFVGQVMKEMKGQGNPKLVAEAVSRRLTG